MRLIGNKMDNENCRSPEEYIPPTPQERFEGDLANVKRGLAKIKGLMGSHIIDIKQRINGEDRWCEGDWIKSIPAILEYCEYYDTDEGDAIDYITLLKNVVEAVRPMDFPCLNKFDYHQGTVDPCGKCDRCKLNEAFRNLDEPDRE